MTNVAIRADATSQIGTGHFMRCLTLADALRQRGAQVRFVSRGLPDHLRDMLTARDMGFASLNDAVTAQAQDDLAHSNWLGTSQEQDARDTAQALNDRMWDWLVVDHYALNAHWERAMRGSARQIMVIDDIADRQHDCDVLLDQNYYADMQTRYTGKVPEYCRLLLGPRYALLREEFRKLHEQVKPRTGEVKRILVFFGGVDADNYTGLAIEALAGLGIEGIAVDVVIGAQHPRRSDIEKICMTRGYACHVQTSRMAELMAAADLAIGAGGSSTWERCCLGLPTLSIRTAENQRRQIADAAEAGLLYAPSGEGDLIELIRRHTKCLFENVPLLNLISTTAMNSVDGMGSVRVAGLLSVGDIEIRRATEDDSRNLFEWRNHPSIRAVSRNTELIDWDAHCSWLASVLDDKDKELLIGFIGHESVGVVRFDKAGRGSEVSIYLVPEAGFTGQGRNLLLSAERWLVANRQDIKIVRAEVLSENSVSQRLFLGADYRIEKISYLKELKD